MDSRKLSVSVSEADVVFLDHYTSRHGVPSRSAAIQQAIALLRASELSDSYVDAWQEWSSDDADAWDATVGDGLHHQGDAAR
jgi:Arc/MetJ-type ribon-helix-helix transcriptional regulator